VGGLTGFFWTGGVPFMFLERTIATVGSFAVITGLKNRLGVSLGLDRIFVREVN